jgi:hypothetical protein
MPRLHDATLAYSKKLCKESVALREACRQTVAEAREAMTRSQRAAAIILKRRKANLK